MPNHLPNHIVKLIAPEIWPNLCATGLVPFSALDRSDGFMHLSTEQQMLETANRYYTEFSLVLGLKINRPKVDNALKWEPAAKRNNELFPHLYGPCPSDNVDAVLILHRNDESQFEIIGEKQMPISADHDFMDH